MRRRQPSSYCYGPIVQGWTTHTSIRRWSWWWRVLREMIPLSGRVPEAISWIPQDGIGGGSVSGRFSVSWLSVLGVSRRRLFVGGRVGQGASRGAQETGRRGQGWGRAAYPPGHLVAPLRWLFGLLEASWQNRTLGVDFVQFREYFLTRISETKNSRKQQLALRHLVNRLVPENARIWHKVCIKHVDNINNVAWNIRNYRYVGDVSASPSLVLLVPSR